MDFFANLDGVIKYTISAEDVELESRTIHTPPHPISVLKDSGCEIVLFTFDLPYKGHKKITLDVILESPITKLASYQVDFQCKIYPAYWPK